MYNKIKRELHATQPRSQGLSSLPPLVVGRLRMFQIKLDTADQLSCLLSNVQKMTSV